MHTRAREIPGRRDATPGERQSLPNLVARARVHLRSAGSKCHTRALGRLWDNQKPDATFAASGYKAQQKKHKTKNNTMLIF